MLDLGVILWTKGKPPELRLRTAGSLSLGDGIGIGSIRLQPGL